MDGPWQVLNEAFPVCLQVVILIGQALVCMYVDRSIMLLWHTNVHSL
jgi:hypothetical protein